MTPSVANYLVILGVSVAVLGLGIVAGAQPARRPRRKHPLRRSARSRPGVTIYEGAF